MARRPNRQLPIPQRGQPLDVSYINDIVSTVNEVITSTSTKPANVVLVNNKVNNTKNSIAIPKAHIYAEVFNVANASTVVAGDEKSTDVNFPYPFISPPVVVATPWNKGGSDTAGKNVSVYVSDVNTSKATIVTKFSSNGSATVDVNVLVIGIPN